MIILIGGKGFIGSAIARYCERMGEEFVILDRTNYRDYVGSTCDTLINANGNPKKFLANREPLHDFDASVRTVHASLLDFTYRRYVHISTVDVYADCSSSATTQESSRPNVAELGHYGFHKYMAEQCVQHFASDWLIVRIGPAVGTGLQKNAVFDIINRQPLWINADSAFQFIDTDDIARILCDLLNQGASNEIFNISGEGMVKVRDIMEMAGYDLPVDPDNELVRYELSIEKTKSRTHVPGSSHTVKNFVRSALNLEQPDNRTHVPHGSHTMADLVR